MREGGGRDSFVCGRPIHPPHEATQPTLTPPPSLAPHSIIQEVVVLYCTVTVVEVVVIVAAQPSNTQYLLAYAIFVPTTFSFTNPFSEKAPLPTFQ